jgi:hypothetical protein
MPKYKFHPPVSKLAKHVRGLLRKHDLEKVASETKLPAAWLKTFQCGLTKSAGVDRVEYLYEYLTGHAIAL